MHRHVYYKNQYRAMFVTEDCNVAKDQVLRYSNEDKTQDLYHPVFCSVCEVEVGVMEKDSELFHFFNVIPGH